eukprot:COSAG02_NODE_6761_length_3376_cov_5.293813_1_plen_459_part_00
MADIVLEIVEGSKSSNPLAGDGGQEDEDTDAVMLEDVFARVRPLVCREDGAPRALIAWSPKAALACFVLVSGLFVKGAHYCRQLEIPSECVLADRVGTPGKLALSLALWPVMFTLPGLFGMVFYRVLFPGGPLDKLGLGTKRVALSQQQMVIRWSTVLLPVAGVVSVVGLCFFVPMGIRSIWWLVDPEGMLANQEDPAGSKQRMEMMAYILVPMTPMSMVCYGVAFPSAVLWYLSMKVAVALAEDDVAELVRAATLEAVNDDSVWTQRVAQPAIKLATHTMAELSGGWGNGTGIGALICWIQALGNAIELMTKIHNEIWNSTSPQDTLPWELELLKNAAGAFVFGCLPLLLAKDLAHVSSLCDTLLNRINSLRLEWTDTATAQQIHQVRPIVCALTLAYRLALMPRLSLSVQRTYPLQVTLRGLNNSQGLGFVVWSKVIDKKTLVAAPVSPSVPRITH